MDPPFLAEFVQGLMQPAGRTVVTVATEGSLGAEKAGDRPGALEGEGGESGVEVGVEGLGLAACFAGRARGMTGEDYAQDAPKSDSRDGDLGVEGDVSGVTGEVVELLAADGGGIVAVDEVVLVAFGGAGIAAVGGAEGWV